MSGRAYNVSGNIRISYLQSSFYVRVTRYLLDKSVQLKSGIALTVLGIICVVLGVHPISGFEQLYFYWSFTFVNPFANIPPGIYPGFPLVVRTYEILVPWILIGAAFLSAGIVLFFKSMESVSR